MKGTERKTENQRFIHVRPVSKFHGYYFMFFIINQIQDCFNILLDILYFHSSPAESNRPYLKHIENVENSDYINACYVDVSL